MVLSCDMDNPVILWRLKSEDERIELLKECCEERYEGGHIDVNSGFNAVKNQIYDEYEISNLIRALKN